MKKLFLHTLLLSLLFKAVNGQTIPSSSQASSCFGCMPTGWNSISGSASVSDVSMFAGLPFFNWSLPAPPSGNSRFITERHNASGHHDIVSASITGLVVGKNYRLVYNVMSSDPGDPPNTSGGYGIAKTATVIVQSNGVLTTQTTNYDFGDPKLGKWTNKILVFEAKSTTAVLTFTGTADWTYNNMDPVSCPFFPQQMCSPRYGIVGLDVESVEPVCSVSNDQVVLLKSSLTACPGMTVNLNSTLSTPAPNGLSYVWYTSQNHSGSPIVDPTKVSQSGTYYAFIYDGLNSCYNTNVSQAKVVVAIEPASQVPLSASEVSNVCPSTMANLNTAYMTAPPHNWELLWYTNPNHSGNPVSDPSSVGNGTYYAFYHNWTNNCFNSPVSTAAVNVQLTTCVCKAGVNQVKLSNTTATNKCAANTVDLTALNLSNIPSGTSLVWFTNATHTGNPIADPGAVGAGTYYAFIYDSFMKCYNTDASQAQVKVTINPCLTNVPLNIKVALQGAMPSAGAKMKNELQIYGGTGLLPSSSPYLGLAVYPEINKVDGVVGEVVDWILVEIRSGSSPGTLLQKKSLLVKPTGAVVDVDGQIPTFLPESGAVRLVIKQRNHLAAMSNLIPNFTAGNTISYDFTTALSQASNEFGDPAQMVQKNGIWCLQSADINEVQDLVIDGKDGTFFNAQFNASVFDVYDRADINLDGVVDGVDGTLFNINFYLGIFSTLVNY